MPTDPTPEAKTLALKYRPRRFAEVVGQEPIVRTLQRALEQGKIANGYLFTGPRGVGKTSTARLMAKSLNCENRQGVDPCNTCAICREIDHGNNMDVLEIDGASTRGIDAIRELREAVKYPPTRGRYRVYIIDEVHMLTKEAFNALLKTLEEPPSQVVFIFATTEPHRVPPTIISRCQRYDFRRISVAVISEALGRIAQESGINCTPEALRFIARQAEGSLRDAISLLEQVSAFAVEEMTEETVREVLGIPGSEVFTSMLTFIAQEDAAGAWNYLEQILAQGVDVGEYVEGLARCLRDLLLIKISGDAALVDASDAERSKLQELAEQFAERDLLRLQNMVLNEQRSLRFAGNQQLALEVLIMKLVRAGRAVELDEVLKAARRPVSPSRQQADTKPAPTFSPGAAAPSPAPSPSVSEPPREAPPIAPTPPTPDAEQTKLDLQTVRASWEQFLECVRKDRPSLAVFLAEGQLSSLRGNSIELVFSPRNGYHLEVLQREMERLRRCLGEVYGRKLDLQFTKAAREGEGHAVRGDDDVLAQPTTQKLLELFDGEVIYPA